MHREGPRVAALAALSSLLFATDTVHAQGPKVRPLPAFPARTAEFARKGAMARLRAPECRRVLTDFRDGQGRPLALNLVPFAVPPDEYLALIPLLDGDGHPLCAGGRSQLLTTEGAARVFVCREFLETVVRERTTAEVYLIHEMLHTLGLGENPPSSQEMTERVKARCAP